MWNNIEISKHSILYKIKSRKFTATWDNIGGRKIMLSIKSNKFMATWGTLFYKLTKAKNQGISCDDKWLGW